MRRRPSSLSSRQVTCCKGPEIPRNRLQANIARCKVYKSLLGDRWFETTFAHTGIPDASPGERCPGLRVGARFRA